MKSLTFILAIAIAQCATSYAAPGKVGVIREGPGPVVTIEGPDGSVIRSVIGVGAVVPPVPILNLAPILIQYPAGVQLITTAPEENDSSTDEAVDEATNEVSEAVAHVLEEEEKLKEVQQNEIQAQQEASEQAIAQIEEQQNAQNDQ